MRGNLCCLPLGSLDLSEYTTRLKTFLIKQQTSSLHHSCSLFQLVLGSATPGAFLFLVLISAWLRRGGKKWNSLVHSWSLVIHRPSLHHLPLQLNEDGVEMLLLLQGSHLFYYPAHRTPAWRDSQRGSMYRTASISALFSDSEPCPEDYNKDDDDDNNKQQQKKGKCIFFTFLDNFQSNVSLLSLD